MGFFEKHHVKSVHEGQKFQCPHCEHKATQKGNLQRHIKAVHEGQMSPCPSMNYKAKDKDKTQKLKMEFLSDKNDLAMEEYFETDVKYEVNMELDRSKELKHKILSDSDKKCMDMEEYFERDVKSEVEPDY